jgi:hypothetical protein
LRRIRMNSLREFGVPLQGPIPIYNPAASNPG